MTSPGASSPTLLVQQTREDASGAAEGVDRAAVWAAGPVLAWVPRVSRWLSLIFLAPGPLRQGTGPRGLR